MHRLNSLKRTVLRSSIVVTIVLVFALGANAYTVVMRGGRRVEIPPMFVVSASTLTYEISAGMQMTLLVAAIDIPATESANNELPGSFLRRIQAAVPTGAETRGDNSTLVARRTITNRDLEASMRRRQESELAYDNRRKQLGLPPVEESRRQAADEAESIRAELEQKRAANQETESYWRERATALRTEMAALDAELGYVRARLDEGPSPGDWTGGWSGISFGTIGRGFLFGNGGHRSFGNAGAFPLGPRHQPSIYVAPSGRSQVSGRVVFGGGASRGQAVFNPGHARPARPVGAGGRFPARGGVSAIPFFGTSVQAYDYSYERSELITRFNELAAARAGLSARWRELEDEARRAGAQPGWLRP